MPDPSNGRGGEGRESYEAATARAVGRLSTLAELASPLLLDGGSLLAWKGKRDPGEEAQLQRAAAKLAMQPERVLHVGPTLVASTATFT